MKENNERYVLYYKNNLIAVGTKEEVKSFIIQSRKSGVRDGFVYGPLDRNLLSESDIKELTLRKVNGVYTTQ